MKNTRTWKIAGSVAVAAMLLTACGGDDATSAESDEPIKIGAIMDQSGATGDVGAPYSEGIVAYVDYINDNGGINGRMIEATSTTTPMRFPRRKTSTAGTSMTVRSRLWAGAPVTPKRCEHAWLTMNCPLSPGRSPKN